MSPIEEYEEILERIFSIYLDATEGFRHIAKTSVIFTVDVEPKPKVRDLRGESPAGHVIYKLGSHETGDYMELSARTGKQIIADNQDDGPNWDFMGAMSIVAAYQFWEDHYRASIAGHLGLGDKPLTIPIFGDQRRFRRCIVHNRNRWNDDLKKLECFKLEKGEGDDHSVEVHFPKKVIEAIWWRMRLALEELKRERTNPSEVE